MGKNKFSTQQSTGVFSFWKNSYSSIESLKKFIFFSYFSQRLIHNMFWNIFIVKLFLKNNSKFVLKKSKVRYSFFKKFKKRKTKVLIGNIWLLRYQGWLIVKFNYLNLHKYYKFRRLNVYIDFSIVRNKDMNYKSHF